MDKAPGSISLRHSSALWVPAVIWLFCLFAVVDAIAEGTPGFAVKVGLLVAGIALVVYVVLAKPALILDNEGITVVNVLRTHRVPFGALVDVRVRGLTSIVARTADGGQQSITSWNAPGVKRLPTSGESDVERAIRNRWEKWERSPHPDGPLESLKSSWNNREGITVFLIVLANIAIRLR